MVFICDHPFDSEESNPIKAEPGRFSPVHPLLHGNGISGAFGSFHLDQRSVRVRHDAGALWLAVNDRIAMGTFLMPGHCRIRVKIPLKQSIRFPHC
jgi:hypothetical protein